MSGSALLHPQAVAVTGKGADPPLPPRRAQLKEESARNVQYSSEPVLDEMADAEELGLSC